MSRSRKYPICKQPNDQYYKKLSNKRIRVFLKRIKNGFKTNSLKRLVNPYDVCDYRFDPFPGEEDKAMRK